MSGEKQKLRNAAICRCNVFLMFFAICFVYSCANIQEENESNANVDNQEQSLDVLSYDSEIDSLKVRDFMQSDIDVILLNHVSFIDGVYTFSLSQDDALSLGADEAKYLYYKSMIENLNKTE